MDITVEGRRSVAVDRQLEVWREGMDPGYELPGEICRKRRIRVGVWPGEILCYPADYCTQAHPVDEDFSPHARCAVVDSIREVV